MSLEKRFDEEVKSAATQIQKISIKELNKFKNKKSHIEEDYFLKQIFGFFFLMLFIVLVCLYLLNSLQNFLESDSWIFTLISIIVCVGSIIAVGFRLAYLNTPEQYEKRILKNKDKLNALIEKQKKETGDFLLASYIFINYIKNKNENTDLIRDFLLDDENFSKSYLDLIDYHCEESVFEKINKHIEFLMRNKERL